MMVRVCDRCQAPAETLTLATTTRTIVVAAGDPSSGPVSVDVEVSMGVQATQDLCAPCFASALAQFAVTILTPGVLSPAAVMALVQRLTAVLQAPEGRS